MFTLTQYSTAIKAGAIALLVLGSAYLGSHITDLKWQDKWDKAVASQAKEEKDVSEQYRSKEQQHAQQLVLLDKQLKEKDDETKQRVAGIIRGSNDRSLRLRKHFTCPASGVSKASTSTGLSDGASDGGLRRDDEEFLVRFAGRCQEVVNKLHTCQAVVDKCETLAK